MTARGQMTNLLRGHKDPRSWILCVNDGARSTMVFGEVIKRPFEPYFFLSRAFVCCRTRERVRERGGIVKRVLPGLERTNRGGKSNRARMLWLDTGDRQHHACPSQFGVADPHFRVDQDRQRCRSPENTRMRLHCMKRVSVHVQHALRCRIGRRL